MSEFLNALNDNALMVLLMRQCLTQYVEIWSKKH